MWLLGIAAIIIAAAVILNFLVKWLNHRHKRRIHSAQMDNNEPISEDAIPKMENKE